jgi:hypothetical protein
MSNSFMHLISLAAAAALSVWSDYRISLYKRQNLMPYGDQPVTANGIVFQSF